MKIKIFGVGNLLLGDDGIGVKVAELIDAPANSTVYQGEIFTEDCLDRIEQGDTVIIIDAVLLGKIPGAVFTLSFEECKLYFSPQAFCHDISLLYALLYGSIAVDGYLIGIQAAEIDYKEELSLALSDQLGEIVKQVETAVKKICME